MASGTAAGAEPEVTFGAAPSRILTRCTPPSSTSGIAPGSAGTPSSSALDTPPPRRFGVLDRDRVAGSFEAPFDGVARPRRRDARVQREGSAPARESEDPLQPDAIHPAGRAGVPGPAAAPAMRWVVVDVPRDGVGLGLVLLDLRGGARVVDRVEHVEELDRLVAAPEARQGEDDPLGRVRVLSAVLADSRQVALDVARVEGRAVEGGREEKDDLRGAPDQLRAHRVHRALGALFRRGAGEDSPGLCHRVEPALVVLGGPERRAVVEVGAPVPLAVPALLEHRPQALALGAVARRARRVAPLLAQRREGAQDRVKEPSDEDALPAPLGSDPVVAVVPVAAPDERQAVGAGGERALDGPHAVLEESSLLCRYGRQPVRLGLSGRNGRRLKERDPSRRGRRRRRSPSRTRRRRTGAREGRPSSACGCRGRSRRPTSAGRRPRRTGARPPAGDARGSGRAA